VRCEHVEHADVSVAMRDAIAAMLASRREDGHAGARAGRARRADVAMCEEVRSVEGEVVSIWGESLSMQGEDLSVRADDTATLRNHVAARGESADE
jgi:hypothetical protein